MNAPLTQFPDGVDNFQIPQQPADTYLSEAEANTSQAGNTLNHPQMHQAENEAITAIENGAALASHDHSDPQGTDYSSLPPSQKHGLQLSIQNTHIPAGGGNGPTGEEAGAADSSPSSWHHTVSNTPGGIGANQAVGGGAWNTLGLNGLPSGYFSPGSTSFPNLPSAVKANADDITALKTAQNGAQGAINAINGQLNAFNNYYQQRANSFLGQPLDCLTFSPTSAISQIASGGTTDNSIQVSLFSRIAILRVHSFLSAHEGVESQVMIFKQNPQPDGSYWAPNFVFFWPCAIFMRNTVGDRVLRFSRDITWQPDGNIYTSSLGNPGERNQVGPNQSIVIAANVELVHYSAQGEALLYTNEAPFNTSN